MPAHILIVDDEAALGAFLADWLTRLGYEVTLAESGAEALAAMRARPPDLALVDLVMPDMGGWELVRLIRAEDVFRHLPILICTAVSAARPPEGLVDGILHKPFRLEEISAKVSEVLERPAPH